MSTMSSMLNLSTSPTAEDLIAQALTAQMALSKRYQPVLSRVQELLKKGFEQSAAAVTDGMSAGGQQEEEDDGGDGDYIDHLQQPGNTKKRKVPANMTGSAHGLEERNAAEGEEEGGERGGLSGGERDDREYEVVSVSPPAPQGPTVGPKQGRMARATKAGLQHKEMLKTRKRQLAAVLGALSHNDTLALDQALSANYPFVKAGLDGGGGDAANARVRLSRRREARAARAYRAFRATMPADENASHKPPSGDFTLVCPSASE